jgi:hypothetical protein
VIKVEPNQQKIVKLLSALIAASAIVVMAVLAVALDEEQTGTGGRDRDRGDGGGWWHVDWRNSHHHHPADSNSDTGCPADHEGRRTQGLPLTPILGVYRRRFAGSTAA